jgi:hypothetical protein
MRSFSKIFLFLALTGFLFTGCGDSEDIIIEPAPSQSGSLQVQFNRSNVLTQSVDDDFATATSYTVDVFNVGTRNPIRPTTQLAANTTTDLQVIVLTGIPVGTFDVVVTAFQGPTEGDQVIATGVPINNSATTIVGTGTGSFKGFTAVTGTPYPVNFPNNVSTLNTEEAASDEEATEVTAE